MKILILGKDGELIANSLDHSDEAFTANPDLEKLMYMGVRGIDFIICFNYAHIIPKSIIDQMSGNIINIHTSFLPWNRGAYPNFFSWLRNTPKGVTIHYIDKGIDTGDIIAQELVYFEPDQTLRTTYNELIRLGIELFKRYWHVIKTREVYSIPQNNELASYHDKKEFVLHDHLLTDGWDTPVKVLEKWQGGEGN